MVNDWLDNARIDGRYSCGAVVEAVAHVGALSPPATSTWRHAVSAFDSYSSRVCTQHPQLARIVVGMTDAEVAEVAGMPRTPRLRCWLYPVVGDRPGRRVCFQRGRVTLVQGSVHGSAAGSGTASPACRMSDLAVQIGPGISEKTGQNTLALRLVNRGAASCFVRGYPSVVAYDRQGAIPFVVRHGGDQMITRRLPTRVLIERNRAAVILLNHYRCDLGDVRTATRVTIGLASATRTPFSSVQLADADNRLRYCGPGDPGSTLTVSPFEPTIRAALRG